MSKKSRNWSEWINWSSKILKHWQNLFRQENQQFKVLICSVFTGEYITGDITPEYLDNIAFQRNDSAKKKREKDASNLEIHNEG